MKRVRLFIAGMCLLAIAATPLGSCRKLDLIADPKNGNTDFRQCQIVRIDDSTRTGNIPPYNPYRIFTYNSKGDPVRIEPEDVATGSSRIELSYDKKGRLQNYAGVYSIASSFEWWHKYFYDGSGRIVGDSAYTLGDTTNWSAAYALGYVQIFYDHLNRIVMEVKSGREYSDYFGPDTVSYNYDAAGNLNGTTIPYDDKVNPLLTNKIWRFLARDYSVNNRLTVSAYNDHGLPTVLDLQKGDRFDYGRIWTLGPYSPNKFMLQYDCSGSVSAPNP